MAYRKCQTLDPSRKMASAGERWRCEADLLADLQYLSSRKSSLASAQASARLRDERQPVVLQVYVPKAKKFQEISLEDDDFVAVEIKQDKTPLGVKCQKEVTLFGAGRAKRLEPYLNDLKSSFNEDKLAQELRECGFRRENCNRDIIANFQKTLLAREDQMSDSEEDVTSCSTESSCVSLIGDISDSASSSKKMCVAERLFGSSHDI